MLFRSRWSAGDRSDCSERVGILSAGTRGSCHAPSSAVTPRLLAGWLAQFRQRSGIAANKFRQRFLNRKIRGASIILRTAGKLFKPALPLLLAGLRVLPIMDESMSPQFSARLTVLADQYSQDWLNLFSLSNPRGLGIERAL